MELSRGRPVAERNDWKGFRVFRWDSESLNSRLTLITDNTFDGFAGSAANPATGGLLINVF